MTYSRKHPGVSYGTLPLLRRMWSSLQLRKLERCGERGQFDRLIKMFRGKHASKAEDILVACGEASVPALTKALPNPFPVVRHHVVCALIRIGDARAASALLVAIKDSGVAIRSAVVIAVTRMAVDDTVETLADEIRTRGLVPVLSETFLSSTAASAPAVRAFVVRVMGAVRTAEAVHALVNVLDDPDQTTRTSARDAIVSIGAPVAVPVLRETLASRLVNEDKRLSVVEILGLFSGPSAIGALCEALDDVAAVRAVAQNAISSSLPVEPVVWHRAVERVNPFSSTVSFEGVQKLLSLADDSNHTMTAVARGALLAMGWADVGPVLCSLLTSSGDVGERRRVFIAETLGAFRNRWAIVTLCESLGDVPTVSQAAMKALALIMAHVIFTDGVLGEDGAESVYSLLWQFDNQNPTIGSSVRKAILEIGWEKARIPLLQIVGSCDGTYIGVKKHAVEMLGTFSAPDAIGPLCAVLGENPAVSQAGKEALRNIVAHKRIAPGAVGAVSMSGVRQLLSLANDGDHSTRALVRETCLAIGWEAATPALCQIIRSTGYDFDRVRPIAVEMLGALCALPAFVVLCEVLEGSPDVRQAAKEAITYILAHRELAAGTIGSIPRQGVRAILSLANEPEQAMRTVACEAILAIGWQDAGPVLCATLEQKQSGEEPIRVFAAEILGAFRAPVAIGTLCEALGDAPAVRLAAKTAIQNIVADNVIVAGDIGAISYRGELNLLSLADDPDPMMVPVARQIVLAIGKGCALQSLHTFLTNPDLCDRGKAFVAEVIGTLRMFPAIGALCRALERTPIVSQAAEKAINDMLDRKELAPCVIDMATGMAEQGDTSGHVVSAILEKCGEYGFLGVACALRKHCPDQFTMETYVSLLCSHGKNYDSDYLLDQFNEHIINRTVISRLKVFFSPDGRPSARHASRERFIPKKVDASLKRTLCDPALSALHDPSPRVRRCAAFALGYIGDKQVASALGALLKDESRDVRKQTVAALREIGGTVSAKYVNKGLLDNDSQVRLDALQAAVLLGAVTNDECLRLIGLPCDDGRVVSLGIRFLGLHGCRNAVFPLIKHLHDSRYRDLAMDALVRITNRLVDDGGIETVVCLIESLTDPLFLNVACDALRRMQGAETVRLLIACLSDPNRREPSIGVLGDIGDREVIGPLVECLLDPQCGKLANDALAKISRRLVDAGGKDVVRFLIENLTDPLYCPFAIDALVRIGDSDATKPLIEWLRDSSSLIANSQWFDRIIDTFGRYIDRESVKPFIECLSEQRYWYPYRKKPIEEVLVRNKDSGVVGPLIEYLRLNGPACRDVAIRILGKIGDREAVRPLIVCLDDPACRRDAICALGMIVDDESVKALSQCLGDPSVCTVAIGALEDIGNKAAVKVLITCLSNAQCCKDAIRALVNIGDRDAVQPLIACLSDAKCREAAICVLGSLGDKEAVQPLIACLSNVQCREATIRALGRLGDREAVRPLIACLSDAKCREAAICVLGSLGDKEAVRPLIACLSYVQCREAAIQALGSLGDREAVRPLIACLSDAKCREAAICVLGSLGDREAVRPLIACLSDANCRKATIRALGTIRDIEAVQPLTEYLSDPRFRVLAVNALICIGDATAVVALCNFHAYVTKELRNKAETESWLPDARDRVLEELRALKRRLDDEYVPNNVTHGDGALRDPGRSETAEEKELEREYDALVDQYQWYHDLLSIKEEIEKVAVERGLILAI